jgi:hypothetical protein
MKGMTPRASRIAPILSRCGFVELEVADRVGELRAHATAEALSRFITAGQYN